MTRWFLAAAALVSLGAACPLPPQPPGCPCPTPTATAHPTATAPPTATSAPTPAPSPSAPTPAAPQPPRVEKVNGANCTDPRSGCFPGSSGEVGFTIWYLCRGPQCSGGHGCELSKWVPLSPEGACIPDSGGMCAVCATNNYPWPRVWDATCTSIGYTIDPVTLRPTRLGWLQRLSGDVYLDSIPGRNCYAAQLRGSGTFSICLPAGARACKDPADYLDQNTYAWLDPNNPAAGRCKSGELQITTSPVCVGPFSWTSP